MTEDKSYDDLISQVGELKSQVREAHDIIDSIRRGEVDAFIVKNNGRNELYTLKTADKTYRIFIEKMNEGAVTVNREGLILYSNSSFAEMIGIPLQRVIGLSFQDIIPASYKTLIKNLLKTAWRKEESRAEIILTGKNDEQKPVLLSMNTMEIDGGMALSIIATDISFQKEAQEQKAAMEKKDEFITIASHELKTPVTSIKGYIQLLKHNFEEEGNIDAANLLGKVDLQINKLTTLISELLDVKKIEQGQLQYHEDIFDFNDLVNEIIEETSRVLNKQSVIFSPAETRMVHGDRNKIGQVISNLIENASKYSPAGSEICVETFNEKDKIRLSVKDDGIGIPKSQQDKIFDRFFRVTGNKENTYSGLGLGLYISHEIITRHHGNIAVESVEGKGSVFYFELPVADQ